MASTGEVACLGKNLHDAFYLSWLATEQSIKGKRILVSIGGDKKGKLLTQLKKLDELNWEIYATAHTHEYLTRQGIGSQFLYKASDQKEPSILNAIRERQVDLIINIPQSSPTGTHQSDGYKIRRLAIDYHIPLITNLHLALMFLQCLTDVKREEIPIRSLQEYVGVK
jgi:methylglyoxal synthase